MWHILRYLPRAPGSSWRDLWDIWEGSYKDPGGILEVSWKNLGGILEGSYKDLGRILEVSWKYFWGILEASWKDPGGILKASWRDLWVILEGSCETGGRRSKCRTTPPLQPFVNTTPAPIISHYIKLPFVNTTQAPTTYIKIVKSRRRFDDIFIDKWEMDDFVLETSVAPDLWLEIAQFEYWKMAWQSLKPANSYLGWRVNNEQLRLVVSLLKKFQNYFSRDAASSLTSSHFMSTPIYKCQNIFYISLRIFFFPKAIQNLESNSLPKTR